MAGTSASVKKVRESESKSADSSVLLNVWKRVVALFTPVRQEELLALENIALQERKKRKPVKIPQKPEEKKNKLIPEKYAYAAYHADNKAKFEADKLRIALKEASRHNDLAYLRELA